MATFRVFLVGSPAPVTVDLPVAGTVDLHELASRVRFIIGHFAEPDEDGSCRGLMIPTGRIHLAVEASE
jgi:hypothetical protein